MTTETISDRQLEIIEAAGKILTTSGVSGLTIKNLAKEMQFSESAIYRHFTSKEEIIIALLEYLAQSMDERYTNAIKNEQSSEEKFTTLFQNQFSFFKKHPHFVVAVFSDGLILEGQQKKVFTNAITTDELIHIVMGTFRLQMYKWRVANFQFDIIRNGDNMIQAVLTLIKSK